MLSSNANSRMTQHLGSSSGTQPGPDLLSNQKQKNALFGTIFPRFFRDMLRVLALCALANYAVLVNSVALSVLVVLLAILQIPYARAALVYFIKYMTTLRLIVNTLCGFPKRLSNDNGLSQDPPYLQVLKHLSCGWLFGLIVCAIDWVFHKLLETPCLYDEIWDTHKLSLTVESPLEAEHRLRRENLSDREILTALTKQYQRVFDRLPSSFGVNPVSSKSGRDSENGLRTGSQTRSGEVGGVAPPVDDSVGQTEGMAVEAASGTVLSQESTLQAGSVAGAAHHQPFGSDSSREGHKEINIQASPSGDENDGDAIATIVRDVADSARSSKVGSQEGGVDSDDESTSSYQSLLSNTARSSASSKREIRSRSDSEDSLGDNKNFFGSPLIESIARSLKRSFSVNDRNDHGSVSDHEDGDGHSSEYDDSVSGSEDGEVPPFRDVDTPLKKDSGDVPTGDGDGKDDQNIGNGYGGSGYMGSPL